MQFSWCARSALRALHSKTTLCMGVSRTVPRRPRWGECWSRNGCPVWFQLGWHRLNPIPSLFARLLVNFLFSHFSLHVSLPESKVTRTGKLDLYSFFRRHLCLCLYLHPLHSFLFIQSQWVKILYLFLCYSLCPCCSALVSVSLCPCLCLCVCVSVCVFVCPHLPLCLCLWSGLVWSGLVWLLFCASVLIYLGLFLLLLCVHFMWYRIIIWCIYLSSLCYAVY